VDYVKEANLRISPTRFRKEVLRDDRRTLGRYDMRFEGVDIDSAGETPGYDASDTGITGAFVAAFHDYLQRELKYESTETYRPRLRHRAVGLQAPAHQRRSRLRWCGEQSQPYVAADLASAIRKNPHLKVFSANGYFDLATRSSSPSTTFRTWTWTPLCAATFSSATTPPAHDLPECGGAPQAERRPGGVY